MKRPDQHVIGELAEKRLRAVLPPEWIVRNVHPDYGVDLEIELVDQQIVTGNRVWVQLKGTRTLQTGIAAFSSDRLRTVVDWAPTLEEPFVAFSLSKKEIDYAVRCPFPLLLVVVDVQRGDTYWHPIRDDVVTQFGRTGDLKGQNSATLRIPIWNRLDSGDSDRLDGIRWYAVEPARMYAFARLHSLVHEFQYRARLTNYEIGDGSIENGEEQELRESLEVAEESLAEALSLDVLFTTGGPNSTAMFAALRNAIEDARASAKNALQKLADSIYTFEELPQQLQPLLRRLAANKQPTDRLFGPNTHRHMVLRHVRRICKAAGVPVIPPHGLRGKHASLAMTAGATGDLVAAALGHESFTTTERHYARADAIADAHQFTALRELKKVPARSRELSDPSPPS